MPIQSIEKTPRVVLPFLNITVIPLYLDNPHRGYPRDPNRMEVRIPTAVDGS